MVSERKSLSIVVSFRQKEHDADMIKRLRMFVAGLDAQACRHGLTVELVIVNWNTPADALPLGDTLPPLTIRSPLVVRCITVPPSVHTRWLNCAGVPFFQYISKNVGIRRACGEFVLATNVDLLFSDDLCRFLASGRFDDRVLYRANRCDVSAAVLGLDTLDEQLRFCERNIIRRRGFVPVGFERRFGWLRRRKEAVINALFTMAGRTRTQRVDTDACGDFTMLAKTAWGSIGGYPEIESHLHIDSWLCHSAVVTGIRQQVLPPSCCVYHCEHTGSWGSMSLIDAILFSSRRPSLDYGLYLDVVRWMHDNHRPLPFNDDRWGCNGDAFPEVTLRG